MLVKELIEKLESYDANLEVMAEVNVKCCFVNCGIYDLSLTFEADDPIVQLQLKQWYVK